MPWSRRSNRCVVRAIGSCNGVPNANTRDAATATSAQPASVPSCRPIPSGAVDAAGYADRHEITSGNTRILGVSAFNGRLHGPLRSPLSGTPTLRPYRCGNPAAHPSMRLTAPGPDCEGELTPLVLRQIHTAACVWPPSASFSYSSSALRCSALGAQHQFPPYV